MPAYETPQWALREAIESVRGQLYPNWELCIADDASPSRHVTEILHYAAAEDRRIKWVQRKTNGNISAASNSALSLASGEYVALMDHDDVLPPHALYEVVVALNKNPCLDIIYSDEDQIDENGQRHTPYFKTDWNIDLLLGHNMISHLGVYRRTLVESIGGFREGFEGSQDYDLALRCADATSVDRIHHIPGVLYHWRRNYGSRSFSEQGLEVCSVAAQRAISEHLHRRNEKGEVGPHPTLPQWSRVTRPAPSPAPLVSLIVPTRDRADLLETCTNGLLNRTAYPNIELLIVDHESKSPEAHRLFEQLKSDPRVRILPFIGPFNYSAINNMAAAQSDGSILGLINDDIEVIGADWLSEMVSLGVLPGVGAVGAKLLYPNNTVQHAGIVLGVGGEANHFSYRLPRQASGYFGRNQLISSVSGVTGACLIVKKSIYEEVGGLDETNLAVAFNDVDLCLKIRERGYRNVWTPHAELYHHESASRGFDATSARFQKETEYMRKRWIAQLASDPFYNVNFSLEMGRCFELAVPSRRVKPWMESASGLSPANSSKKG
jgi:GT2 family glycosyltransferase